MPILSFFLFCRQFYFQNVKHNVTVSVILGDNAISWKTKNQNNFQLSKYWSMHGKYKVWSAVNYLATERFSNCCAYSYHTFVWQVHNTHRYQSNLSWTHITYRDRLSFNRRKMQERVRCSCFAPSIFFVLVLLHQLYIFSLVMNGILRE